MKKRKNEIGVELLTLCVMITTITITLIITLPVILSIEEETNSILWRSLWKMFLTLVYGFGGIGYGYLITKKLYENYNEKDE